MAVELTGRSLKLGDVVAVAREGESVTIGPKALEEMRTHRAVVEHASAEGTPVYGVTTGVGMRRDSAVDAGSAGAFNRSAILGHLVGRLNAPALPASTVESRRIPTPVVTP